MHTTSNLTPSPDDEQTIRFFSGALPDSADDQPEVGDWLLRESMPIPQWKREMMIADQIMEKRKAEAKRVDQENLEKVAVEAARVLREKLSSLGIDADTSCTIVQENGETYWIAEEAIVRFGWHQGVASFIIRPAFEIEDDNEFRYFSYDEAHVSDQDKVYYLSLLHECIRWASKLSLSRAEPPSPQKQQLTPFDMNDLRLELMRGVNFLRRLIEGVDRGEHVAPELITAILLMARWDLKITPTCDTCDPDSEDLPF